MESSSSSSLTKGRLDDSNTGYVANNGHNTLIPGSEQSLLRPSTTGGHGNIQCGMELGERKPDNDLPMVVAVKIYTEWANHYLERARCSRHINDLQVDMCDGVLLAEVIYAVCNIKVKDIKTKPRSPSHMLENIKTCLSTLSNLGIDHEGYTTNDIRQGNLKSILCLFYNLSRYKQQIKSEVANTGTTSGNNNYATLSKLKMSSTTKLSTPSSNGTGGPGGTPSLLQRRASDRASERPHRDPEKKSTTATSSNKRPVSANKNNNNINNNNNASMNSSTASGVGSNNTRNLNTLRYSSLPRSSNPSRTSSRSTSPSSSSFSGSSGIPLPSSSSSARSVASSSNNSSSRIPATSLKARTDSPAPPPPTTGISKLQPPGTPKSSQLNAPSSRRSNIGSVNVSRSNSAVGGSKPTSIGGVSVTKLSSAVDSSDGQTTPTPTLLQKYKTYRGEKSNTDVHNKQQSIPAVSSTLPSSKVSGSHRSKSGPGMTTGTSLSRKEVEEAIGTLKQKRSVTSGSSLKSEDTLQAPSSAPPPAVTNDENEAAKSIPYSTSEGFGFNRGSGLRVPQQKSSRAESKTKTGHLPSPKYNSRSTSNHSRGVGYMATSSGDNTETEDLPLDPPTTSKSNIMPPSRKTSTTTEPGSIAIANEKMHSNQGTPKSSKKVSGIPSVMARSGGDDSRYNSLNRRRNSSKTESKSRERSNNRAVAVDSSNVSASSPRERPVGRSPRHSTGDADDPPAPKPPPRGTSKLSSAVSSVPYPEGMSGPQVSTDSSIPRGSLLAAPSIKPSSGGKHQGRQKARALYNVVKQRDDKNKQSHSQSDNVHSNGPEIRIDTEDCPDLSTETSTSSQTPPQAPPKPPPPDAESSPDLSAPEESSIMTSQESDDSTGASDCFSASLPPPVKPLPPLMSTGTTNYIQPTSRPNFTFSGPRLTVDGQTDPETSTTPLSETGAGPPDSLDLSGYMSDFGGSAGGESALIKSSGYASDQSGYLSEGGGMSVYGVMGPGRMHHAYRFREGLHAVIEAPSLQSRHQIPESECESNHPEDDISSVSSDNISDIATEMTAEEIQRDTDRHMGRKAAQWRSKLVPMETPKQLRKLTGVKEVSPGRINETGKDEDGPTPQPQHPGTGEMSNGRWYSSDTEEIGSKGPKFSYNAMRKYATSDVEADYNDLDVPSSNSLDPLTSGSSAANFHHRYHRQMATTEPSASSDYYFSDTESINSTRPPLPRLGARKSDVGEHPPTHMLGGYSRRFGPPPSARSPSNYGSPYDHLPPQHGSPMFRRPSSEALLAQNRHRSVPLHRTQGSSEAIRSGGEPAAAMFDFADMDYGDKAVRSMSLTGGMGRMFPPQPQETIYAASPLLNNVKLPYSISSGGVKTSYSNSSLSRGEHLDDIDIKGSHLSLASIGSCRSTVDEKQSQEIRRLRLELELAQQKVTTLSSQLTTNANMVAAFDQNLASMNARLQCVTSTTVEKDAEIQELRNALDNLKKQSSNHANSYLTTGSNSGSGDQLSSVLKSADSLTSLTSNSSGGQENKKQSKEQSKEKKSGWLRQSFGNPFKRKSKGGDSDTEGYQHEVSTVMAAYGATASEAEDLIALKRELEEKQLRLTDAQLEALASMQQAEQLRETMEQMSSDLTNLRLENERLSKVARLGGSEGSPSASEQSSSAPSENRLASLTIGKMISGSGDQVSPESSELKKRLCLDPTAAHTHSVGFDLLSTSALTDTKCRRVPVSIVVSSEFSSANNTSTGGSNGFDQTKSTVITSNNTIPLGFMSIEATTTWDQVDQSLRRLFREYVTKVDPVTNLGLNADSIQDYTFAGTVTRRRDSPVPDACQRNTPFQIYVAAVESRRVGDAASTITPGIEVALRGGPSSQSCLDELAFDTLIPKTVLQRYMCVLLEHQWLMLSGPSGTGKTYLANRLADYLVARANRRPEGAITTFNVDHKSTKELRTYLSTLAEQMDSNQPSNQLPVVIILDNLHHVTSFSEIFNNFLSVKHQRSPYIIGTMNQSTSSTTNLQVHHNFRWVLCTNHMEPVKGFLGRYLRRKLITTEANAGQHLAAVHRVVQWIPLVWQHLNRFLEMHSSADVTIGPRLFLPCPPDLEASRVWFTDLWNYSLVPYLLEAVREGLQLYGRRHPWEDPAEWLIQTWPWDQQNSASGIAEDWVSLLRLRPEDVGYDTNQPSLPPAQLLLQNPPTPGPINSALSNLMGGPSMRLNSGASGAAGPSLAGSGDANNDQLMNMLLRFQLQEASNCGNN